MSSKALGLLGSTGDIVGAPRAGDVISEDVFQSYVPDGPHRLGWALPASDLMALFGCELQEEELEIP